MIYDAETLLLTEAVMRSFEYRCDYAIFYPEDGYCPNRVISAVIRQGFLKPEEAPRDVPLYAVDMHAPLLLLANMETTLKEPFSSNEKVLRVIRKAQQDLQPDRQIGSGVRSGFFLRQIFGDNLFIVELFLIFLFFR